MYLSDRDIKLAIENGELIVDPKPNLKDFSSTSLDLRLDSPDKAKVWDIDKFKEINKEFGRPETELVLGKFDYKKLSPKFLAPVSENANADVFRKGNDIIVKPRAFFLWQTKEVVGTRKGSNLICFVDGKSTLARMGLLVHLTAPTIHTTWYGNITLEITNVGPFDFVLSEDDLVVQITVATVTSTPEKDQMASKTYGQTDVSGQKM